VSSNRKLRRARQARAGRREGAPAEPRVDRDAQRRQTAAQRFKKPGSDKLWSALLGWQRERLARIWLAQVVHDAARDKERGALDAAHALREFAERFPEVRLGPDDVSTAAELWLASGDAYDAREPAPKWTYLKNLASRLELGDVSAEDFQDDWEIWTSVALAAPVRKTLMEALGQAEQAAMALGKGSRSDNVEAVANVLRALWVALAYGDEAAFARARTWSAEWLARADALKPKAP
jgi:hypothetical protein